MQYKLRGTNAQRNLVDEAVVHTSHPRAARLLLCTVIRHTSYSRSYYQASEFATLPSVAVEAAELRAKTPGSTSLSLLGHGGGHGLVDELPIEVALSHISPGSRYAERYGSRVTEYRLHKDWYLDYLKAGVAGTSKARYKLHTEEKKQTSSARAVSSTYTAATEAQAEWIRAANHVHTYDESVIERVRERLLERLDHTVRKEEAPILAHLLLSVESLRDQTTEEGLKVSYKADRHGRIYTRSLVQGLPSALKAQVFATTTTYDWASCHGDLSRILAEVLGVELPEETDKDDVDAPRKAAKIAAHGLRYGGRLPRTVDQMNTLADMYPSSVANALQRLGVRQGDLDALVDAYAKLETGMRRLQTAAQEAAEEGLLPHPLGCEYDGQNALAYYLQGMEGLLTKVLTEELDVALADHDGIEYVSGDVDAAVRQATQRLREWAGLEQLPVCPKLVQKELASDGDHEALERILTVARAQKSGTRSCEDADAEALGEPRTEANERGCALTKTRPHSCTEAAQADRADAQASTGDRYGGDAQSLYAFTEALRIALRRVRCRLCQAGPKGQAGYRQGAPPPCPSSGANC